MTTLRTLECLVALVEHGSVSAAAAALRMSQPALSHQIAALERELGVPVVERLWRGVRVTAAGRACAEEAQLALRAADQAIEIGRLVGEGGAGRLRIACFEAMTPWLIPVLRQWRFRRPDVRFDLGEYVSPDAVIASIEQRRIDIAIGPKPNRTEAHLEILGEEEIVVVADANHYFSTLSTIPLPALASEPFVHYVSDNWMASFVDQLTVRHGLVFNSVVRTRTTRSAAQLAAAGIGVTLVPISAVASGADGAVRRLNPIVHRDIVAVLPAPSDTLVQRFVTDVRRHGMPAWTDRSDSAELRSMA
jgi:DNA-binding transcriptional LysR family regulator